MTPRYESKARNHMGKPDERALSRPYCNTDRPSGNVVIG
jgi:hypothetical protein